MVNGVDQCLDTAFFKGAYVVNKLEDGSGKGPDIAFDSITLPFKDFRCHIKRGTKHSLR